METKEHFVVFVVKSVSCTNQELGLVKQHWAGKIHQKNATTIAQSRDITFNKPVNDDKHISAEVLVKSFIALHNISFLTPDHLAPLSRVIFPNSNIAKIFRSRRTKTTWVAYKGAFQDRIFIDLQISLNFSLWFEVKLLLKVSNR